MHFGEYLYSLLVVQSSALKTVTIKCPCFGVFCELFFFFIFFNFFSDDDDKGRADQIWK